MSFYTVPVYTKSCKIQLKRLAKMSWWAKLYTCKVIMMFVPTWSEVYICADIYLKEVLDGTAYLHDAVFKRSLRPCFRWVQGQEKGMFSYGGQAATYMHVSHRHKKAQVENKRQNKEQINRVLSSRVSKEKLCFVFVLILCLLAPCIENEA